MAPPKYEIHKRPWWLDYWFDRFKWYRRLCGDHWELWYIEVTHSEIWHNRLGCYEQIGRPPCARGTPLCEDYR